MLVYQTKTRNAIDKINVILIPSLRPCRLGAVVVLKNAAWRLDSCRLNMLPQLNAGFETEEQLLRLEEGDGDSSNGVSGAWHSF